MTFSLKLLDDLKRESFIRLEDARADRYSPLTAITDFSGEKPLITITNLGWQSTFPRMQSLRNDPLNNPNATVDYLQLLKSDRSVSKPVMFANAGASFALVVGYGDRRFLALTAKGKNISGYTATSATLQRTATTELGEELLLFDGQGALLPLRFDGQVLDPHYSLIGPSSMVVDVVPYDVSAHGGFVFEGLVAPDRYDIAVIEGGVQRLYTDAGFVGFHMDPFRNSLQFLWQGYVDITNLVSDAYTAETFPAKDQPPGVLEARFVDHGLILVELDEGKLTNGTYVFQNGLLQPKALPGPVTEALTVSSGLNRRENVLLDEIIAKYK